MDDNLEIAWLKNNTYKPEYDQDNLWHNGLDLICNGYRFTRYRQNEPKDKEKWSLNWKCKVKNCKGSVTILLKDKSVIRYVDHTTLRVSFRCSGSSRYYYSN